MGKLASEFTNAPNLVTMGRVVLIPGVLLFIDNYSPLRSFIAALLYLVSAATDALDGYLARSRNQVSVLGKFLDPLADKLAVTAVLVFMVGLGRVPAWIVVVMIARDLAVNGLRSVASAHGLVISASEGGKVKTALQLVAIVMLLIHFRYPVLGLERSVDYHAAGMYTLYVSLAMSILSGVDYLRRFVSVLSREDSVKSLGLLIVRALDGEDRRSSGEVARRIGGGSAPCWLISPGPGELGVIREHLACDPVQVVRGASVAEVQRAWGQARAAWSAGPGTPVAVGYLSYDLGRRFERLRGTPPPPSGWPDLEMRFYDAFWVREAGRTEIWATDADAADRLQARVFGTDGAADPPACVLDPFQPMEPADRYLQAAERVLEYLRAGDVYQVNLARRLRARLRADGPPGLELFARLQTAAPAPHAIWLGDETQGRALVGNSPERFLRREVDHSLFTAPIKGTRARAATPDADAAAARELLAAPKDHAEHVMIVDLERNDLGRICETGSVEVVDPLRLLTLPSVHHLVSTVRGRLRPGLDLEAILRATFPGGSITGAPKLRAMEIIDELEPACRGPYTGATGWLGAAGDFDLAIAIRTALLAGEELTLWVGGGIVADSVPRAELEETDIKARAFAGLVTAPVTPAAFPRSR